MSARESIPYTVVFEILRFANNIIISLATNWLTNCLATVTELDVADESSEPLSDVKVELIEEDARDIVHDTTVPRKSVIISREDFLRSQGKKRPTPISRIPPITVVVAKKRPAGTEIPSTSRVKRTQR